MKAKKVLIMLLLLDMAFACIGLANGWSIWAWIILCWALLTAKTYMNARIERIVTDSGGGK